MRDSASKLALLIAGFVRVRVIHLEFLRQPRPPRPHRAEGKVTRGAAGISSFASDADAEVPLSDELLSLTCKIMHAMNKVAVLNLAAMQVGLRMLLVIPRIFLLRRGGEIARSVASPRVLYRRLRHVPQMCDAAALQ